MSKRKNETSQSVSHHFLLNKPHIKTALKVHRFLGVSLSGGKADKTSLAVLEYYPEHKKIFLSHLNEKIKSDGDCSADLQLYKLITSFEKVKFLAVDAPLKLPKCMRCRLKCPGYEVCDEPEVQWMWKAYKKAYEKRKPKKIFTPYTERCCESYIATQLEEPFHPPHALGANMAPLAARAHFLGRRLKVPKIEVYPKLSLWRIGRALKIQKSYLRFHRHAFDGQEARQSIVERLIEKDIAFIYRQDQRSLVDNHHSFEAFLCALTGVLKFLKQVEERPKDFPKGEAWVEIPKTEIHWG